MLPEKINITLPILNGELKEVEKEYYYKFNFNAINSFRKDEGINFEEFNDVFSGLEKGDFNSIERIGKLFYYAIKEGMRICGLECDIKVEDVLLWMNESGENFSEVIGKYSDSVSQVEDSGKKK
jgi:hypothetical protein